MAWPFLSGWSLVKVWEGLDRRIGGIAYDDVLDCLFGAPSILRAASIAPGREGQTHIPFMGERCNHDPLTSGRDSLDSADGWP
jgi:hypothetical protein